MSFRGIQQSAVARSGSPLGRSGLRAAPHPHALEHGCLLTSLAVMSSMLNQMASKPPDFSIEFTSPGFERSAPPKAKKKPTWLNTSKGVRPRRLTLRRATRLSRVALLLVVRQHRLSGAKPAFDPAQAPPQKKVYFIGINNARSFCFLFDDD
jgi:hypothetical protein